MLDNKPKIDNQDTYQQMFRGIDSLEPSSSLLHEARDHIQQKFAVIDVEKYISILEENGKFIKRVAQTDLYFMPNGIQPDYQTSYIRLREEKLQDADSESLFTLSYKTKSDSLGETGYLSRRQISIPLSEEQSCEFLDYADSEAIPHPRKLYKDRSIYELFGLTINVDSTVINDDNFVGSFIEIDSSDDADNTQSESVLDLLGLASNNAISLPYASVEQFKVRSTDNIADQNEQVNTSFGISHFNAATRTFVQGYDSHLISQNFSDEQKKLINDALDEIVKDFSDYNPVSCRKLYQSYKSNKDAFKSYKSPLPYIEFSTLYSKRIDSMIGGGGRILFSYVRLKNGSSCILVHKVCTHTEYDKWLDRH